MSRAAALVLGAAGPQVLESFDGVAGWRAQASDGVTATVATVGGQQGGALRLGYDFGTVSGYAFISSVLPVEFPENYELRFRIRGTGGVNDLQLKFVDAAGENVWWYQMRNFRPSPEWQTVRVRRRDLEFAWGPTRDKTLRRTARAELVVVRGRDGGAGHVDIDELQLLPLPATPPSLPSPRASDARAIDGDPATRATVSASRALTLDFGGRKPLGGIVLHWAPGRAAARYRIDASDDGRTWRPLRTVTAGNGDDDPLPLGDIEVRALRLVPQGRAQLAELDVMPPEWGADGNAFTKAMAAAAPRGRYPRGFTEQSYWTLVNTDGGLHGGLIGEDGAIEIDKGGFSIEPVVEIDGKRIGWADMAATHALEDGYLPIPTVAWQGQGWRLDTTLLADASDADRGLIAHYRLTNSGDAPRTMRLLLAVRPYQVNPPAQFLSQQGGVSPIRSIARTASGLAITAPGPIAGDPARVRHLRPARAPDAVRFGSFDSGEAIDAADGGAGIGDPQGMASAALVYNVALAPGESFVLPVALGRPGAGAPAPIDARSYAAAHSATRDYWRERLNRVRVRLPESERAVADTLRTATAHMLMSRAGPMLKPGTRSYDRSWIRDGSMISDGLLRLGIIDPVIDYAEWYSNYLFDNGKVPCCVDFRGADPVPENDSHGQYIHLLTQLYRFTGDRTRLERQWPSLRAAAAYMEGLRQSERTPANQTPDRRMLFGLMPPSISHEGYSAKAQYSLWDDFWALRGYKDASLAAHALGKPEAAVLAQQRDEFGTDLHAAIRAAAAHWRIDYIPGATSLGDLDATSTTMAFDPAGEAEALDPAQLRATFDRYWANFVARREGRVAWDDYTPYELRTVSAFVRLGQRDRAAQALAFFLADRRPTAWNGWAEVVGRKPREIRFIGDMPHAWIASDYVRVALDLFAYVRESDGSIVLGAGLTPAMLAGEGASIAGLRSEYGTLDFALRIADGRLVATLGGDATPPGGFVLPWPLAAQPGRAWIDGGPARLDSGALRVPAGAKRVEVELRQS